MESRPETTRLAYGLIPLVTLLERAGLDPSEALKRGGVPRFALFNPRYTISFDQEVRVCQAALTQLKRPGISLELAELYDLRIFSVLGLAMQSSDTLGEALQMLARHPRLAWGASRIESVSSRKSVRMRFLPDATLGNVQHLIHERDAASFLHVCRQLSGQPLAYKTVRFAAPAPMHIGVYLNFFRSPVKFESRYSECEMDPSFARIRLPLANKHAKRFYEAQCRVLSEATDRPFSLTDSIRAELNWSAPNADLADVAASFSLTQRTVQRRLAKEGVTFAQISREVRLARARRLLELDTPLTEIAVQCGFSDESAFSRAFKSWVGVPPLKWRRKHRKTSPDTSLE